MAGFFIGSYLLALGVLSGITLYLLVLIIREPPEPLDSVLVWLGVIVVSIIVMGLTLFGLGFIYTARFGAPFGLDFLIVR